MIRGARVKNLTVVKILLFIYLAVLLKLTVFRDGFGETPLFSNGDFNFELFTDLIRIYHRDVSVFLYLCVGNIVTFIPFGFLVMPLVAKSERNPSVHALRRGFAVTVGLGALLSLFIEVSQWAFGVGVSEIDDLILNVTGVFLGALACLPFVKKLRRG